MKLITGLKFNLILLIFISSSSFAQILDETGAEVDEADSVINSTASGTQKVYMTPYNTSFGSVIVGSTSIAKPLKVMTNTLYDVFVRIECTYGFKLSTAANSTGYNCIYVKANAFSWSTFYLKFCPPSAGVWYGNISATCNTGGGSTAYVYANGTGRPKLRSFENQDNIETSTESSEASVNLYPNPAIDNFTIQLNNIAPNEISIWDISGRMVMKVDKELLNSSEININNSKLTKGLYFVRIQTASKTYLEKISIGN